MITRVSVSKLALGGCRAKDCDVGWVVVGEIRLLALALVWHPSWPALVGASPAASA
jgi:hypothetical protein